MKKLLLPIFILLCSSAAAQLTTDDVNLMQAMYGKNKRDLLQQYLTFKDTAASNGFWKLYDRYETERKKLGRSYVGILQDYANKYDKLDDKSTNDLVTRASANNIAFENLYLKYYKMMVPVVGTKTAAQFVQAESYFRSVVRLKVMDEIPFIGEIDKTQVKK